MTTANINRETDLEAIYTQGYNAVVYAAYDNGSAQRGDIVSKHKTQAAAQKAARGDNFLAVRDLSEIAARVDRSKKTTFLRQVGGVFVYDQGVNAYQLGNGNIRLVAISFYSRKPISGFTPKEVSPEWLDNFTDRYGISQNAQMVSDLLGQLENIAEGSAYERMMTEMSED